jgi:hypothetical protein
MIIVLLIDTSTCTAQTFPNGETLLDAARHTAKSLVQVGKDIFSSKPN